MSKPYNGRWDTPTASMTLDVYADLFDADLDDVATNLDVAIRSAAYPPRNDNQKTKA
jgi:hypothetical protein